MQKSDLHHMSNKQRNYKQRLRLTKYENYVGRCLQFLDLCADANADALAPCVIAILHRVVPTFAVPSVLGDAATHAIQCVPRLARLCAPGRRHLRSNDSTRKLK